ncbi:uncharacterized protein LOC130418929 [Triplophysa dalaica]|uniref:uncharacterized protein LOC130418929 n=1 Tax=Triplophysa dalaica TaxID=1582913 RepID=UPI0024DFAF25|nr:uncharacterized protein LOC130418929 [Triplophysa dalaica]
MEVDFGDSVLFNIFQSVPEQEQGHFPCPLLYESFRRPKIHHHERVNNPYFFIDRHGQQMLQTWNIPVYHQVFTLVLGQETEEKRIKPFHRPPGQRYFSEKLFTYPYTVGEWEPSGLTLYDGKEENNQSQDSPQDWENDMETEIDNENAFILWNPPPPPDAVSRGITPPVPLGTPPCTPTPSPLRDTEEDELEEQRFVWAALEEAYLPSII